MRWEGLSYSSASNKEAKGRLWSSSLARAWVDEVPRNSLGTPSSSRSFQGRAGRAGCVLPVREVAARGYDSGCTGETQGTSKRKHTVER